jgi:primosomal replication protein N
VNQFVLSACIAEANALRYTPAGVPALDLSSNTSPKSVEAGQTRQVKVAVKAVALGAMAETLGKRPIGSAGRFTGFLANPRNGKYAVFHIQAFVQD